MILLEAALPLILVSLPVFLAGLHFSNWSVRLYSFLSVLPAVPLVLLLTENRRALSASSAFFGLEGDIGGMISLVLTIWVLSGELVILGIVILLRPHAHRKQLLLAAVSMIAAVLPTVLSILVIMGIE